jgi:hypothetical protein
VSCRRASISILDLHQYDPKMNPTAAAASPSRAHQLQQAFKWVVYTLLIINWVHYLRQDWTRASHTLTAASSLLDWTSAFATSIDVTAWFVLLAMFELETYVLDDEAWTGWVAQVVHGIRLLCFLMIAHTVYAFSVAVADHGDSAPVDGVADLCGLSGQGVSYVYNLEYTEINDETCSRLPPGRQFYWVGEGPVVSDRDGLELERDLAWADLIEAVVWLIILAAIEIVVRLQERGITGGWLLAAMNLSKRVLYLVLIGLGVYWAWLGHWLYFWDELVWIGGFAAIELNVSEWRSEILEKKDFVPLPGSSDE